MTHPAIASIPTPADVAALQQARLAEQKKIAHWVRNCRLIALSYLIDGVVLTLFHLVGTIGWVPVLAYTLTGVTTILATGALIASGWTQRFKDPGITVAQTLVSQAIQLAAMHYVPEVGFMFVLLLFIVYSSLTMRVEVRVAVISWVVISLATGLVLMLSTEPPRIPDNSLAEQAITVAFLALTLWRCVWIGSYNSNMTTLLKKRGRELGELTARVDMMAHHDELTGVLNRRSLLTALRSEQQRAERQGLPLCVALIDLDKFKSVNDTLGHLAGDKTLKIFASTLTEHTRRSDRFGRYGGEEFLLIMTNTTPDIARVPIDRMREALSRAPWDEVAPGFGMTFSCGVACYQPGEGIEATLQRADEALYRAKADGRNCTRLG